MRPVNNSTVPNIVERTYGYLRDLLVPSLQSFLLSFRTDPVTATIRVVITLVVITAITTRLSAWSGRATIQDKSGPQSIITTPYWLPFLGHWLQFAVNDQSWFRHVAKTGQKGTIGLWLLGQKVAVVISVDLIRQAHEMSRSRLSDDKFKLRRRRRFFGYRGDAVPELFDVFEKATAEFETRSDHLIRMARLLEQNTPNFVTGTKSLVDQEMWERGAAVEASDEYSDICFANLQVLVRDFSSHIILTALLGTAFVQANDDFVANFGKFSREYHRFMTGWPYWIMPGLGPPAGAREKCLRALEEFVQEVQDADENKAGKSAAYDDLSDVNHTIWTFIQDMKSAQAGLKLVISPRNIAGMLLELVWKKIWYSHLITFWILVRLHQKDGVSNLNVCREEAKKVLQVTEPQRFNSIFSEPPKLKYNDDIVRMIHEHVDKILILKAAMLEVVRLDTEMEEWYEASDTVVLTEHMVAKSSQSSSVIWQYLIKSGETVYLASAALNRDEEIWTAGAGSFLPRRWLTTLSNAYGETGGVAHSTLQAMAMEHVQQQAQRVGVREVLLLVTAILSLFELRATHDGHDLQPRWTTIVAGVRLSRQNVRARIVRRDLGQGSDT